MSSSLQLFDDPVSPSLVAQDLLRRARSADAGHHDELRDDEGAIKPAWADFASHLGAPLDDLERRREILARQIREDGVTYNVYGGEQGMARPWSLEVLPRIVAADEWRQLERGVAQRARLLNQILLDAYGDQHLLKKAMLPAALVLGHPGYLRGLQGVRPLGDIYLHVMAFDLVRGPDGAWWVVSQRTQAPSGLGYVMQNRLIVSRLFPEAYRQMSVQHLASSYRRMVETVSELASPCAGGDTPRLALLTPGPYNETYFEHAYLARYLGLPLVEGGDLVVRDERVFIKTVQGLEPIHGLLRRLDDDFCDPLELRSDSTLGVPGLMQAVRAGHVVLANALGTGFLESPAVHGFLPALSRHLLGEELALPSLPTWWCGEGAVWDAVRPELAEHVIRPSFPHMGTPGFGSHTQRLDFDTVVARTLTAPALAAWRDRIDRRPADYTLQRFQPYAQTPVWDAGMVRLRSASLRVYALADGRGQWHVLPGGMTRIATRDAGPVSMQLGGSSLDTWVLTQGPVDTFSMLPSAVRLDELVQRQRPVASRTGENLFWMGRYTERAELQLRLVQSLLDLRASDDDLVPAPLHAVSQLAEFNGLVPPAVPSLVKSPRVFERAMLEALGDGRASQGACSLGYNLVAIERTAQALRDRLSPAHARLLRQMSRDFESALRPPDDSVDALSLDAQAERAQAALDHLAVQLAAATGAQTDRMTRDAGWRLLSVGRLIERLSGHVSMLKSFWSADALAHPQGGDLLLDLFDSAITFRARFQRRLEQGPLLALLVMDEANPRSLACVLRRLRTELGKLPDRGSGTTDLLALLPHQGVGATLQELCDPEHGHEAVLNLLNRLLDASWRLSDEVGRLYFAHAEPEDAMVSA
ncbi:circularly permuted type 2 ATP-grasp protein [Aquabacterium sp. A3]|uniref:circularly permuted type 2 ATP-grasp protein n=1 Tax=Aquabacterium sp. A3 TaxID=3132829 RepID=UPI00311A5A5E